MNEFTFADINLGQEEKFSYIVTQEKQDLFTQLSGDINPMHINAEYAAKNLSNSSGGVLVYGMLTASLFSTLAGVYLPGKYCLLQHVETTFIKPVSIGDTITISGKVIDKDDTFKRIKMKVYITNQNNEKVCRGVIVAGVLK